MRLGKEHEKLNESLGKGMKVFKFLLLLLLFTIKSNRK